MYYDLEKKVQEWAKEKGLDNYDNRFKQCLKSNSELGELSDAIIKDDLDGIKDGIGDTLVTLIILAQQLDLSVVDCLEIAYNEIAPRKGETVDGIFIKD